MVIPDIDIIAGLEEAYYAVVRFLGGINADTVITKKQSPARKNYTKVASRSLFVIYQSLYDSFDSTRRSTWDVYWSSLPFGSHAGADGYPGSGYSAFIYVNAPRYKAGMDPLLDPPALNLLLNPSFNPSLNTWIFSEEFAGYLSPENAWFFDGGYAFQPITLEEDTDYKLNISIFFLDTETYEPAPGVTGHMDIVLRDVNGDIDGAFWSSAVTTDSYEATIHVGTFEAPTAFWIDLINSDDHLLCVGYVSLAKL